MQSGGGALNWTHRDWKGGMFMIPISAAAPRPAAVQELREMPDRPKEAAPSAKPPLRDEYVPEKKREPWGRYWLEKAEDGSPKICFEDPESPEAPSSEETKGAPEAAEPSREEAPKAEGPKSRRPEERKERCVADTGPVDRELERLRKKKEELEQRLSGETDETRRRELERKLSQAEEELRRKDNDGYRRRHTRFS